MQSFGRICRGNPLVLSQSWNEVIMRGRKLSLLLIVSALLGVSGCQWLPQPKEVDQGKVDRAMDNVEKGQAE